jgi:hypothetical protein
MATNFLIALATALGSATLILLVLRFLLKVVVPNAFKEMISIPDKAIERQTPMRFRTADSAPSPAMSSVLKEPAEKMRQMTVDTVTLSALSGRQIVDLLGSAEQPLQVTHNFSDISFPTAVAGAEVASLLNTRAQGARGFIVTAVKIPKVAKENEKKVPSREEILSPPGQSAPNFGTAKKSLGVPNETLCGSAS